MSAHQHEETASAPWLFSLRTSKLLFWLLVVFGVVILGQGAAIMALLPLKTKELAVLEFRTEGNNFVYVHKPGEELRSNDILTIAMLREYVMNRETVDRITEKQRYAKVMSMSADKIGEQFRALYGKENKESLWNIPGLTRDIRIRRDSKIGKNIFQIEFETIDNLENKKTTVTQWVVTIKIAFADQKVTYEERILNPLGLVVLEYHLSRRAN